MPNWLGICWAAIEFTVAWIWLCGMLGVNTYTSGPKSGSPARCAAGLTAAVAVTRAGPAGRAVAAVRAGAAQAGAAARPDTPSRPDAPSSAAIRMAPRRRRPVLCRDLRFISGPFRRQHRCYRAPSDSISQGRRTSKIPVTVFMTFK